MEGGGAGGTRKGISDLRFEISNGGSSFAKASSFAEAMEDGTEDRTEDGSEDRDTGGISEGGVQSEEFKFGISDGEGGKEDRSGRGVQTWPGG
jgi:hypothetical protein